MLDDINWKELALAWRRINKEAQKGYDGKNLQMLITRFFRKTI